MNELKKLELLRWINFFASNRMSSDLDDVLVSYGCDVDKFESFFDTIRFSYRAAKINGFALDLKEAKDFCCLVHTDFSELSKQHYIYDQLFTNQLGFFGCLYINAIKKVDRPELIDRIVTLNMVFGSCSPSDYERMRELLGIIEELIINEL